MNNGPLFSLPFTTKAADKVIWPDVTGTAFAAALAETVSKHRQFVVVFAKDTESALQLENEIRFFASPGLEILALPDWETLPYDLFSPHQDIISQRIHTLSTITNTESGLLIIPISTALHLLPPQEHLHGFSLLLKVGEKLRLEPYKQQLETAGYRHTETVFEHGEYAQRGSILDIFPMGSDLPFRIELFDDEIETLRTFDPETQRSIEKVEEIKLLPATEFPWEATARSKFKTQWISHFPNAPKESSIFQDVSSGIRPPGIEYYLPLFFDNMATLFDYLPKTTTAVIQEGVYEAAQHFWLEAGERFEERRHDRMRPLLPPASLFFSVDEFFARLKAFPQIKQTSTASEDRIENPAIKTITDIAIDSRLKDPLIRLKTLIESTHAEAKNAKILICAESTGRREVISDLLKDHAIQVTPVANWQEFLDSRSTSDIHICTGFIVNSFKSPHAKLTVLSEASLYGHRVAQSRRRKTQDNTESIFKSLTELTIGSPVVHIDHGVGRYQGLQCLDIDGQTNEFLTLVYADEAKLYVPVTSLHLISRYSGTDNNLAPLHKLGTDKWSAAKEKALEKIRDTAAELLEIYAKRDAQKGFAFSHPKDAYFAFCQNFPFEETPDQMAAIEAVEKDMLSTKCMDRLVCGDVGFGKTEVAMRAAFLAAYSGKQVAVLAPTTLLAQQHFQSFSDRFSDTPVKVDVISRFKNASEQNTALESMAQGKTDIIIGTHKLLQPGVKFKNLGLLIIDEEHRFGVQQKERMKALRTEVDILALTATPIPRTLNMAMGGIRDLSIIATPPAKRLSVKTFVRQHEDSLIKEAILREILRGGQVFFLHNDVKTIEKIADEISTLTPEARVTVAHGQMRESRLEQVMSDFYHKRFNVLVCTTIIETGIDIPSANTIIIARADKFGLAQLHQLRGRVGRSHHQAYAFLLTPPQKTMTADAVKRLEAITLSQDLGAGFALATHDLEIRGAGELLGEEQSGQIQSVGFSLYMELLEQTVEALQSGKSPDLATPFKHGTEVNLRLPAIIPEEYLPDVHTRLILYKRIANAKTKTALSDIQSEIIDRFGILPEQVKLLIKQTRLKLRAEKAGISKIDAGDTKGKITFAKETAVDPFVIVQLVQKNATRFGLSSGNELSFQLKTSNPNDKLQEINDILNLLGVGDK